MILNKEKDNASPVLLQGRQKHVLFYYYFFGLLGPQKMAATLFAVELKTLDRNQWVRKIINDGVETSARKSLDRFQIIKSHPRQSLGRDLKSLKTCLMPDISLSQLNRIIDFINLQYYMVITCNITWLQPVATTV